MIQRLHQLISECWLQKSVPQEFKDVPILPIFKNKGNHRDCGNYRDISLLAISGKIMEKIAQAGLAKLAENVLTESQCGFRPGRSQLDMIFSIRQIQEIAIEQEQELYMVFVDFRKAFDTLDRRILRKVLKIFGCPQTLIDTTQQFHDGTRGKVIVGSQLSDDISVNLGTKQGCVLVPTLFTIFLTVVLTILHQEVQEGVYIRTRSDGKLFNLARVRAKIKSSRQLISALLFADDTALVAYKLPHSQQASDSFAMAARKIGLQINTNKTEVTYRNKSAFASFGKLEKRLWSRNGIRLDTKCKVYQAVVLPALLYSAEAYTLYREHIKKLEAVQRQHLRCIMKIRYSNYVSNVAVLRRANMNSIEATLATTQLCWAGHVLKMNDDKISK